MRPPLTATRVRPGEIPAAPWRRVVARLLDSLAVFWLMFALVVLHAAFWVPWLSERITPEPWATAFMATVTYAVFLVVYEVIFVAARGQTPGKDLMKIKVVRSADGQLPTRAQAVRRSLVHAALWMVPTVWIAMLAQFFVAASVPASERRRTLADLVADTEVIHFEDPEERPKMSLWENRNRMAMRRLRGH